MEALDYWKLCERVTIYQAAYLIVGHDPRDSTSYGLTHSDRSSPEGYGAVKTALIVAVRSRNIDAEIAEEINYDDRGEPLGIVPGSVDIDRSYVNVDSLIQFLRKRNFPTAVFGTSEPQRPDYLDPIGAFYAPKLAAAVYAWLAVTIERQFESKGTPKHWIAKWLRENAADYGLNKSDGTLNDDAIEKIAKIVNWKPEGGAGKTLTSEKPPTPKRGEK